MNTKEFGCENCFQIWFLFWWCTEWYTSGMGCFVAYSDYGFSDHIVTHRAKYKHRENSEESHFFISIEQIKDLKTA